MITIQLPDGSSADFDTDDPKAASAAAKKVWSSQKQSAPQAAGPKTYANAQGHNDQSFLQKALGAYRDVSGRVVDAALFGAGDKIAGAGAAAGNAVRSLFGSEDFDPSGAYEAGKSAYHADQDKFSKDHPLAAGVGTATGLAAGLALPVGEGVQLAAKGAQALKAVKVAKALQKASTFGTVAKDAKLGARAVAGAKQGAAYAATGGFVGADGDLGDHVNAGLTAAPVGALAGGSLPILMAGAGKGLSIANNALSSEGRAAAGTARANDVIAQDLETSGLSPDDALAELTRRQTQLGVPAIIGDLSETLRGRVGSVSRSMGPGQEIVRRAIDERQKGMNSRIEGYIDRDLGRTVNPEKHVAALDAARDAAAGVAYKKSNQHVPVMSEDVMNYLEANPSAKSAIDQAAKQVAMADTRVIPAIEKTHEPGKVWQPPTPDTEVPTTGQFWNGVAHEERPIPGAAPTIIPGQPGQMVDGMVPKMDVIDHANTLFNNQARFGNSFQADPATRGLVRGARAQGRGLRDLFDAQNPAWPMARNAFRSATKLRQAFQSGTDNYGKGASALEDLTKGMNPQELDQFVKGHRTQMAADVRDKGFWGDTSRHLTGSQEDNNVLGQLYGNAKGGTDLPRFLDTVDAEKGAHLTYKAVRGGSNSPRDLAADADSAAQDLVQASAYGIGGAKVAATKAVVSTLFKGLTKAHREAYQRQLATALSSKDIGKVSAILKAVVAQQNGAATALAKANKRGVQAGATSGFLLGPGVGKGLTRQQQSEDDGQVPQDIPFDLPDANP